MSSAQKNPDLFLRPGVRHLVIQCAARTSPAKVPIIPGYSGRSPGLRFILEPRLPTEIFRQWPMQLSSPFTVAGQRGIHTLFPILPPDPDFKWRTPELCCSK